MRVLIAPDKFKGSLTAAEVAAAIAEGLDAAGVASRALPLADGGDGSVAAALAAGFTAYPVTVTGADGRPISTELAFKDGTAVVEVANTCGLATLPDGVLAPMTSSSFGFGQAVAAALRHGAQRIVLALGGSASTDVGAGMLAALGVRFLDDTGRDLPPSGETLARVTTVDSRGLVDLAGVELVVATDVTNPLLGDEGAAVVFGPQKGASPAQVHELEAGVGRVSALLGPGDGDGRVEGAGDGLAGEPGTGAAGGIGFACRWLGARRVPGADYFLELLGFDEALTSCDAVITGEGRMDAQTLNGKLPAVVAARSALRPVYAVVGQSALSDADRRRLGMREIHALSELSDADSSRDPALSRRLAAVAGERIAHSLLRSGA